MNLFFDSALKRLFLTGIKPLQLIINTEITHYKKLSSESRRMLLSIFLFSLALPLMSVFINTFLWRELHSVGIIVLYNFSNFIGVPAGFYLNGFLLKKYPTKNIYFGGAIAQGVIVALLLFFSLTESVSVTIAGICLGIVAGIYWANRTLLLTHITKNHQRIYFVSLEQILVTLTGIIAPFFIGWFIVSGEHFIAGWSKNAYQFLALFFVILLFFSGKVMYQSEINIPRLKEFSPFKPSKRWQNVRSMMFFSGMLHGVELVLPILVVMILLGNEKTLGTIMAVTGIFVSLALYKIARTVGQKYRFRTLCLSVFLSILGASLFNYYYSVIGVICYFILNSFATTIRGTIIGPLSLEVITGEEFRQARHRYLYIADRELFVNIGRNTSLSVFFLLHLLSPDFALRATPLIFALTMIAGIWFMSLIEKELVAEDILTSAPIFNYVRSFYNRD